ncbi:general secretion pathway protein E [Luteimonas sp. J16]|nr:general secretion pathway protein E [Luteimonas sp. J16]
MEPRLNPTPSPPTVPLPARLPPGKLALEPVIAALQADGLLAEKDAEHARASARHVRGLDAVHPLVVLANLKLPSARRAGGELGLEALTEWLAAASGRPYLRIDPTRIVVAEVTDLVSHAYARRHRILPVEVHADRVRIATSEPMALDWLPDIQRLLRREIELVVANPLDLHRYTMEFYGVTRSVRGAQQDGDGKGSQAPSFEQLVELGRAGDVNADDHHIVNIVDWLGGGAH